MTERNELAGDDDVERKTTNGAERTEDTAGRAGDEPGSAGEDTAGVADAGDAASDEPDVAATDPAPEADDDVHSRLAVLSDQYMRLAADFDNFRRRTRANETAVREQAAARLVKDLLPVIDNLRLALAKADAASDDGFTQGIVLIEQQLTSVLQNHGVRPIDTAGQPFDPHTMEAVAQLDGQGLAKPGHVLEELRRGYMLHDKVLRAAQVVVAKAE